MSRFEPKNSGLRRRFCAALLGMLCITGGGLMQSLVFADESGDLTLEEKTERRLQFNQFVESKLASERASQKEASALKKPWKLEYTSAAGYESNVNLRRTRTNTSDDNFWQNTLDGEFKQGDFTWAVTAENLNYPEKEASDYLRFVFRPDYQKKLTDRWSLKLDYDLSYSDYDNNKTSTYLSHKLKPTFSYKLNSQWTPSLYGSWQWKEYDKRNALDSDNTNRDLERQDLALELGGGLRYAPNQAQVFGLISGYKQNDSNDRFRDLNDYHGYKLTGYGYNAISKRISTLLYAGLDHKTYDSRTFNESDTTQVDDLIYVGGSLTVEWERHWNVILSYLYKQNYSTDSTKVFVDTTYTAGLKYSF